MGQKGFLRFAPPDPVAAAHQTTGLLVFVDVKNACYSLVRRLVFELGESDDIFAYLVSRLQLPPDLLRDFLHACRMPPAARIALLPPHLQAIVQQHYACTWLFVQDGTCPARTTSGSKPGIPCADIVFMLAFMRANSELRE